MLSAIVLVGLLILQSVLAATYPDSAIAAFSLEHYVPPQLRDTMTRLAPPGSRRHAVVTEIEHAIAAMEDVITHPFDGETRLADLLHHLRESGQLHDHHADPGSQNPSKGAVIIRPAAEAPDSGNPNSLALSTDVHPEGAVSVLKVDKDAKRWDQLDDQQKAVWRRRLADAGAWFESEGETVLKGVFFSSYAGLVGDIAAQAFR